MGKLRRRLLPLTVGLLLAGFLVYAFWPRPAAMDLAPAVRGPLKVTVDEDGKTRIKDRYIVSAPLTGRLVRITLHPGDRVVAGKTVLAAIEPCDPGLLDDRARAEAEARVKAAEATRSQAGPKFERARVAHRYAAGELDRVRKLVTVGGASAQEYADQQTKDRQAHEELKTAQFAMQIADFEVDLARAALTRTRQRSPGDAENWRFDILAPVSGRVLRVLQESTAVVTPGHQLLEVGDPSDLEVEVDVLSSDAVKIAPGGQVFLERWGGDETLRGRVRLVEPAGFLKKSALGIDEQRVNVIIDFVDPPEKYTRLGHAYRVEARIVVWSADDVVKVPAGALFRQGEDWTVYAVEEGRVQLRRIEVGRSNGLETEIRGGLSEGESVVLHPGDKIQAGARVVAAVR
jgi:HlyD family secretion protein